MVPVMVYRKVIAIPVLDSLLQVEVGTGRQKKRIENRITRRNYENYYEKTDKTDFFQPVLIGFEKTGLNRMVT